MNSLNPSCYRDIYTYYVYLLLLSTSDDGWKKTMARLFKRYKGSRSQLLQTTNPCLGHLCLEIQLCIIMSCACFEPEHSLYLYYECGTFDKAAESTTFKIFSNETIWAENRTHHLSNAEGMYDTFKQGWQCPWKRSSSNQTD